MNILGYSSLSLMLLMPIYLGARYYLETSLPVDSVKQVYEFVKCGDENRIRIMCETSKARDEWGLDLHSFYAEGGNSGKYGTVFSTEGDTIEVYSGYWSINGVRQ